MKLSSRDFVLVRRGLVLLATMACLGAAAVALFLDRSVRAETAHRQAQAERDDLLAKLARAGNEETTIRRGAARYRELSERGAVGAERRLDWVESLAGIGRDMRIPDLQYEFAPQRRLDLDGPFMVSAMTLRLELLHEQELFGLLDRLSTDAAALLRVRACRLERLADGGPARLRAECAIDWITLGEHA